MSVEDIGQGLAYGNPHPANPGVSCVFPPWILPVRASVPTLFANLHPVFDIGFGFQAGDLLIVFHQIVITIEHRIAFHFSPDQSMQLPFQVNTGSCGETLSGRIVRPRNKELGSLKRPTPVGQTVRHHA